MKPIINFLSNDTVQVSAVNAGIWLSALDWGIKIVFGLPTAIYICLKLYSEFLKPDQKSNKHENNLPE